MSNTTTATTAPASAGAATDSAAKSRIASIDIMRGVAILVMLLDHVREKIFYHQQVSDPLDLDTTSPGLFFTRYAAHLAAPTFVFLTGLSAWLYSHPPKGGYRDPSSFLFKRGLFLVFIEITVINFSWFLNYETLYLQVIWIIGLSMIALSALCKLNYWAAGVIGFVIVFGHNLLTPIGFQPGEFGYTLWTILHDRGVLVEGPVKIQVSYPLLPWIGVILLGYFTGPLYARDTDPDFRRKVLIGLGCGCLALLLLLRGFNIYGETQPWVAGDTVIETLMSFLNYTKYPPSLDFLLVTLGIAFLLLSWFESHTGKLSGVLETFGSAPMFFYIFHLYVLVIGYKILLAIFGPNHGDLLAVNHIGWVWVALLIMSAALYFPTKAFAEFKHRTNQKWAKYF